MHVLFVRQKIVGMHEKTIINYYQQILSNKLSLYEYRYNLKKINDAKAKSWYMDNCKIFTMLQISLKLPGIQR